MWSLLRRRPPRISAPVSYLWAATTTQTLVDDLSQLMSATEPEPTPTATSTTTPTTTTTSPAPGAGSGSPPYGSAAAAYPPLAATGMPVGELIGGAAVLLVAGGVLLLFSRRRRTAG